MKEGKYDFVFSSYIKDEENLEFIPVAEEELVLITPKDHPLADEKSVNLGDTTQYDYIYFSKNSGLRNVIDQLFSKVKGYPKIAYEGEEDSTVAGLVAAGFGIAIVPNIPLLNTMDVSVIPISSPEIHRYIYLVTLKKKYLAPVAEEFVEFVKNNYSVKG